MNAKAINLFRLFLSIFKSIPLTHTHTISPHTHIDPDSRFAFTHTVLFTPPEPPLSFFSLLFLLLVLLCLFLLLLFPIITDVASLE